jgi:hypothetical protein
MLLSFDAMLMAAEPGTYVSDNGKNKGTAYDYTLLKFSTIEGKDLQLSAAGHVELPAGNLRTDLHWDLEVEPKGNKGSSSFRVLKISGRKIAK